MRARPTPRALEALVLTASAAFYVAFILRSDFTFAGRRYYTLIDDSMISMVYARNLADGHGLVWQPGERVEGYTNLLWTLWMAVLHLLPFSEATAGLPVMISGAAILIATMLVVRSICRVVAPERALVPAAAMALTGLSYPLVFWTLRGMETGLSALLVALAVRLALDLRAEVTNRRLLALAAVAAAAVLTRDDLAIPLAVVAAFGTWWAPAGQRRRVLATVGGALALTFGAHTAFRLAYYGDALPNTYYLKVHGIPLETRLHRGVVGLTYSLLTSLYVAVGLSAVALAVARRSARLGPLLLLGSVVAAEFAYSLWVGGDYAEQLGFPNRFLATALPLLMVLAAIGMSDLLRREGTPRARLAGAGAAAALLVAAAILQGHGWTELRTISIFEPIPYATARVVVALGAALLVVYLAVGRRPRRRALQPVLAVTLFALALAAVDYAPVRNWAQVGADDRVLEREEVATAVLVREHTDPSATGAVIVAGNWAYFSHRGGIDLLGKADPVIARRPQHPEVIFKPGHTKWDYRYSIGKLRPTIVAGLAFPTDRDLCDIRSWGYRQIAPRFFVRADAPSVDVAELRADLSAVKRGPPYRASAPCA